MIVCLYLAAGLSSRLQGHKLSLPLGGRPLGSWALEAAMESRIEEVLAVTREAGRPEWLPTDVEPEVGTRLSLLHCPVSWRGQSRSIISGVRAAQERGAEGVLILLADQPLVTSEMINSLIDRFQTTDPPPAFVAASLDGVARPPVLLSKSLFPDLLSLQGDQGARNILRGRHADGVLVPFSDTLLFADVDTEEDYQTLLQRKKGV
ncbi:NTP transferase domain-containing protein [Tumebacillus sp. ITR2]|uniref:NTP transferase domain-containing protein n=1 Tax=Tumebacillus amylolyticus TaxID=2801339 RepID=A0ABS1JAX4_9BACL|nr:nucleotidyltransferase family protein [Tumebacillus amylolyticus]MBL0387422.1 NTP transferase domain-containing protein [Tumebacillus amylolyticus]